MVDRMGLEPTAYRTSLTPITRYPVSTASRQVSNLYRTERRLLHRIELPIHIYYHSRGGIYATNYPRKIKKYMFDKKERRPEGRLF